MLKEYRRHFIISNMALSGIVLLITFIILGAANIRSEYNDLENTMNVMLQPWNSQSQRQSETGTPARQTEDTPRKPERRDGEPPDGEPERRSGDPRDGQPAERREEQLTVDKDIYKKFTCIIYHQRTGEYTVLSEGSTVGAEATPDVLWSIVSQKETFGMQHGLIYYVDKTPNDCKIALVSSSYITGNVAKNCLFLALIYLALMSAIFLISMLLSKTAVKPLEQAIEMERNFVADISHDLKTPITIVLTNNSILRSNPDMPYSERKQWTDSTEAAAKNMMKLVNEMLTLSSLESVDRTVEKERVCLSMAVEKCVLQLESLAYESEITVNEDIAEDVYISSTPEYTERICSGLIENALKYEPKGGTIDVAVTVSKKTAAFTVSNRGSTISEEDLPHIFERFYRGDKARSSQKGFGLGLPIIDQMVELVGAKIRAESSPEIGTRFTVIFDTDI